MNAKTKKTGANRKAVAEGLSRLLADTYTLYVKTHGFHWNVTGPLFPMLHGLFEAQYTDLAAAADEIAERIRALDLPAPASFAQFGKLAAVKEQPRIPAAERMVAELAGDHETAAATARRVVALAQKAGDEASADLAIGRISVHDKAAWMLRSSLA